MGSILVNELTNQHRIVAQKSDNPREVTVNMNILKSLKYHVATPLFHQWRDGKVVYGLNFIDEQHANGFNEILSSILENLKEIDKEQTLKKEKEKEKERAEKEREREIEIQHKIQQEQQ